MATPLPPQPETPASLPSPPFVAMKGIPNFRAVGGLPIANEPNKSLRSGFLFRCAEPTKATPEDLEKIRSLGINRIYDLRSIPEIKKHQIANIGNEASGEPYSWEGVERVYAPVFPEESWDPVSMAIRHKEYQREDAEGMTNAYKTVASQGAKAYGLIVREMLARPPPGNGFIIHCTAGKDRTGVLAALLLQLAGVPNDAIVEEYVLTNQGLGKWLDYLVTVVQKNTGATPENARRMASARGDSMLGYLQWQETQGGAAAYFEEKCGLSKGEVQKLKSMLIVDEPPTAGLKS